MLGPALSLYRQRRDGSTCAQQGMGIERQENRLGDVDPGNRNLLSSWKPNIIHPAMGGNDSFCTDTDAALDVKPCRGHACRKHTTRHRTRIFLEGRDHALALHLALDIAHATSSIDPVRQPFPISTMHLYTLPERIPVLCIQCYGIATVAIFEETRRPLVHETHQHGLHQAVQFSVGQMHFDPLSGRYLYPARSILAAGPALDLRAETGEPLRPFLEGPLRPLEEPARQRIVL